MGDLLSAASLLLAVVGILYGLWYGEIEFALGIKPSQHSQDNMAKLGTVSSTLAKRAVPLAIAASLVSMIFLPDAIRLILLSSNNYLTKGPSAFKDYGAVETAFCVVIIFTSSISMDVIWKIIKLKSLKKKLSRKDK